MQNCSLFVYIVYVHGIQNGIVLLFRPGIFTRGNLAYSGIIVLHVLGYEMKYIQPGRNPEVAANVWDPLEACSVLCYYALQSCDYICGGNLYTLSNQCQMGFLSSKPYKLKFWS